MANLTYFVAKSVSLRGSVRPVDRGCQISSEWVPHWLQSRPISDKSGKPVDQAAYGVPKCIDLSILNNLKINQPKYINQLVMNYKI